MTARIGILTISDRASSGEYEDRGGPAIQEYLNEVLTSSWQPVAEVIPDDQDVIEAALIRMCDDEGCCLVITTGGTGPSKRDVTPEATEAVAAVRLAVRQATQDVAAVGSSSTGDKPTDGCQILARPR